VVVREDRAIRRDHVENPFAARPQVDPLLKEWIALHAHDDFAQQALWLKSELDAAGATPDANERVRLSAIFSGTQELEIAFHQAPLPHAGQNKKAELGVSCQ
jgi:thiaminase